MNDIRRTFLWVIFGFSMVLLWDQWQIYNGQKATFFPAPTAATLPRSKPQRRHHQQPKTCPLHRSPHTSGKPCLAGPSQVPGICITTPVTTARERIDVSNRCFQS
jgi:YidC/Oxa1 family membrane protein insertase